MLYFQSGRHYRTENLLNDFFLGHLQPSVEKNFTWLHNIEFRILWRHMQTKNKIFLVQLGINKHL